MKGNIGKHLTTVALCAALSALSSCNDDLYGTSPAQEKRPLSLTGQLQQQNQTRAHDYGFVDGDRMGIYIVDYESGTPGVLSATDNRASNVLYTFNSADYCWAAATQLYWKDDCTPVDVYGYYPGVNYIENPSAYRFEVSYKQNAEPADGELSEYETSDFLWGKAVNVSPTTEVITVAYQHRMAGIRVQLVPGTGFVAGEWDRLEKQVQADNTVRTAIIDMADGVPVADGDVDRSVQMMPQSDGQYRAVVVPQTVAADKTLITVTINGLSYTHSLSSPMKYQQGKLHNFTVTVNKNDASGKYELKFAYDGIAEWINDETSHQFSSNSYVIINCPEYGTLKDCITNAGYDYKTMQNLKVTGELTDTDIYFMRDEMSELKNLNLKDVRMRHVCYSYWTGSWESYYRDDAFPSNAFSGNENKTLRSIVLPSSIKRIEGYAFGGCHLMYSTLEVPEGVTYIGQGAFCYIENNGMELILPNTIDSIESNAFYACMYSCELNLNDNIKYLGENAFAAPNFRGVFHIPSKLKNLPKGAFGQLGSNGSFTGDIDIPQGTTEIGERAFGVSFQKRVDLNLPSGIKRIGNAAFSGMHFSSLHFNDDLEELVGGTFYCASIPFQLTLPPGLTAIGNQCFFACGIEGELVIPENCLTISGNAFGCNGITKLTLPSKLEMISESSFYGNGNLTEIKIPKYVEYIGNRAFAEDYAVQTVICLNPEPPILGNNVFEGIPMDKVVLQVPEASVEIYRHSSGWNSFKNITAYHELAFNIPEIKALDKGITREGIVRAEGAWEVSECPSWVKVSPMSGTGKTEVSVTVQSQASGAAARDGQIVFRLTDKGYTTYTTVKQLTADVAEDETIVLQKASAGSQYAIPLFIVGDGYDAEDIADGKYLADMKEQMEYLFSIEPYKTYRNYFTVSTAIACSPESGIDGQTKFDSENYNGLHGNADKVWRYALANGTDITSAREGQTTIMVLLNTNATCNNTDISDNGRAVSWMGKSTDSYPFDQKGFVLHELGGTAFGKLGPEGVNHFTFMKSCGCPGCNMTDRYNRAKAHGWYGNVSVSAKISDLPWQDLMFHDKYSKYVDVYEGALNHARGTYRSENMSVMGNTYIPYYNTVSREIIVRRIMECAGETFTFEKFVEKDKIEIPQ